MIEMDLFDRLCMLIEAYRAQAALFSGRRAAWRLNRADELERLAWSLI